MVEIEDRSGRKARPGEFAPQQHDYSARIKSVLVRLASPPPQKLPTTCASKLSSIPLTLRVKHVSSQKRRFVPIR